MLKKYTIEEIRLKFEKEEYKLLSKKYINNKQKLEYICPEGHKGSITYNHFQRGTRCAECAGNKKKIIGEIKPKFEKEGYILLSKEYRGANYKLEYICSKGHKGSISWSSFQQGKRCNKCKIEAQSGENNNNWKGGVKKLNIPLYNTYAHKISWCEEVRGDPENQDYLQVKCTESSCRKWFTPTILQVCGRISAVNSIGGGNFYCSEGCKQNCSIYGRIKYPKGFKHNYNREVQPELRELVLKRDNFECQRCGSKEKLQAHHYESIYSNPIMSADLDNCIILCKKCHKLAHKDIGCRPIDLTRKNLCKGEKYESIT